MDFFNFKKPRKATGSRKTEPVKSNPLHYQSQLGSQNTKSATEEKNSNNFKNDANSGKGSRSKSVISSKTNHWSEQLENHEASHREGSFVNPVASERSSGSDGRNSRGQRSRSISQNTKSATEEKNSNNSKNDTNSKKGSTSKSVIPGQTNFRSEQLENHEDSHKEGSSVDPVAYERSSRSDGRNSRGQRSRSISGIRNKGNTCYINSILQCMCRIQEVQKLKVKNNGNDFMTRFCYLLVNMTYGNTSTMDASTEYFLSEIRKKTNKFANYRQKDAHSFLMFLINQIEENCIIDSSRDEGLFSGTMKTKYCYNCNHVKYLQEKIFTFVVPVTSEGLETVLKNKYDYHETDEDLLCYDCQEVDIGKVLQHTILPTYLIILFNRFDLERNRKNNCPAHYPEILNLENLGHYKLFAVCNHIGSQTTYGHYTATVLDQDAGEWFEYDDDRIFPSDINNNKEKAYILFYRKEND